jgi:hypothetical protein
MAVGGAVGGAVGEAVGGESRRSITSISFIRGFDRGVARHEPQDKAFPWSSPVLGQKRDQGGIVQRVKKVRMKGFLPFDLDLLYNI